MIHVKRIILSALLVLVCSSAYSQIGVTSYALYAMGVNTSTGKKISGELKLIANRPIENLALEADVFYNFNPAEHHRFFIGLGINGGPLNDFDHIYGITLPAGLEFYPLQDFKKLSLLFELTPFLRVESGLSLRTLWGIRYTFGDIE